MIDPEPALVAFDVTQEDIDLGCRFGTTGTCPVERAMSRSAGVVRQRP